MWGSLRLAPVTRLSPAFRVRVWLYNTRAQLLLLVAGIHHYQRMVHRETYTTSCLHLSKAQKLTGILNTCRNSICYIGPNTFIANHMHFRTSINILVYAVATPTKKVCIHRYRNDF